VHGRLHRLLAAAAAMGAALALTLGAGPGAAAAGAAAGADAAATTMSLVEMPAWVGPSGLVSVTVDITRPPPGARLLTTLYDRVPNTAGLQRSLFGVFGNPITPNGLDSQRLDELPRSEDGSISVNVSFSLSPTDSEPPKVILVPAAGVYPLDLQVVDARGKQVAQLVTWVIRLPAASTAADGKPPLGVAVVLPVRAPPSHQPDGSVAVTAELRDRVRSVVQALAATGDAPLTIVPTPEVLDSLAASTASGDAQLLAQLRSLAGKPGRSVLAGPYVDLDMPAWLRQPSLRDRVAVEWSRGAQALQARLGVAPIAATAVAPSDLTNDAVRWLHDQGIRQALVVPGALAGDEPSPTRPFTLSSGTGASLQAMAVNDVSAVGFDLPGRRGLQETLAGLAQTALDAPDGAQATVLAPPLDDASWTADPQRLAALVQALAQSTSGPDSAPLVQLVPLASELQLPSATTGRGGTEPLVRHAADKEPPSLADFDQRFAEVQRQLASFRQMLVTTATSPAGSNAGLVRATALDQLLGVAGAQELTVDERNHFVDGVANTLRGELSSVAAPARQTVTLTSRSGSIPLTLHNTLGYPVQVRLTMESSERLAFPDGTTQLLTLTGENTPVEIRVHARTSGDAPLTITVTSPDGSLLLATTDYTVRSTAVSGVGLALTIGAVIVLLVWWIRSWRRGRRRPAEEAVDD
jgi:hypothetical protein